MRSLPPAWILHEDNHLLVINKPAGIATMGTPAGGESLVTLAKHYLKQKYLKPGNVYLGVVSRLDALVTGVIVLARTSKAASRLTRQFSDRSVRKVYWAVVEGSFPQDRLTLVDYLRKDDRQRKMVVCDIDDSPPPQLAELSFHTLARWRSQQALEIELATGRKHQIRVQLASRKHPILGDHKYGATRVFPSGIALHARILELLHPTQNKPMQFEAAPPESWRQAGLLQG